MSEDETLLITDLVQDSKNAQLHTPRTIGSIVDSINTAGLGRGIVIDENNVILAGNGAVEAALEALGPAAKVIVIEQDKAALTVVQRKGLTPEQKVRLALDDNRAPEHSQFDPTILAALKTEHNLDLSKLWTPVEWGHATEPLVPFVPLPTTRQKTHADRRPELRIGAVTLPLTPEQDDAFDALLLKWIDEFGSTAGAAMTLADCFLKVIEDDDAVRAL